MWWVVQQVAQHEYITWVGMALSDSILERRSVDRGMECNQWNIWKLHGISCRAYLVTSCWCNPVMGLVIRDATASAAGRPMNRAADV